MIDREGTRQLICSRYGSAFAPPGEREIVGVSRGVASGVFPLHGLRHPPQDGTSGWYVWVGEMTHAADFFEPMHHFHLDEMRPDASVLLALEPGWRFLLGENGYLDVWFDSTLLL